MTRLVPALMIAAATLFGPPAHAVDLPASSSITDVTLFLDRAQITRTTHVDLPAGTNRVLLRGVPQTIAPESLRASGRGVKGITILGVELTMVPVRDDSSAKVRELVEKVASLGLERGSLDRRKESLERQRAMIAEISLEQPNPEAERIVRPRSAKEIAELLTLMSETEKRIDPELRATSDAIEKNIKEVDFVKAQLNLLQNPQTSEAAISVSLASDVAGPIDLQVSYHVRDASWRPAYTLTSREGGDHTDFTLDTFGLVSQRSGEVWNNVALTLSTARPQIRLDRPQPRPIFLDIIRLLPQSRGNVAGLMRAEKAAAPASSAQDALLEEVRNEPPSAPLEEAQATVNLGPVITFKLPHRISLDSDGTTEKVKVGSTTLTGTVTNVIVPKESVEVYREAVIQNAGEIPLLPGQLSIFANDEFIGSRSIALTQPGEEMRLPIGTSQQVTAKRILVKKFEDDTGIVRSIRRIRHDYRIEVTNNSRSEQRAIVVEGVPVARNDKVSVTLEDVEPSPLASDDKLRVSPAQGVLEWHLAIPAKGKKEMRYSTVVEFPASEPVSGIPDL